MSISAFIETLRELDKLKTQFPRIPIGLTGVGFYMPALTAEQWMQHYGTPDAVSASGGETPDTASNGCEGRSRS